MCLVKAFIGEDGLVFMLFRPRHLRFVANLLIARLYIYIIDVGHITPLDSCMSGRLSVCSTYKSGVLFVTMC